MNKTLTKCALLFVLCVSLGSAKAQSSYNFKQYDLGVGLDINSAYTDAQTLVSSKSARLTFNYNHTPFVNYVFEWQMGNLQGGNAATTTTGRQFNNSYNAFMMRGQLQAGEIIDYSQSRVANAFKNLYLSTGIGFVLSNIKEINRYSVLTPGFYTGGDDKSTQLMLPVRLGYEFKIFNKYGEPGLKIDLGYQYNYIFGDNLDGFIAGRQKDVYTQISVGIKVAIDGIATYRKDIAY